MKNKFLNGFFTWVCLLLVSCGNGIDEEKCASMILAHPFFKEVHVGVVGKDIPECKEAHAGCIKGWYFNARGANTDAHYYYMYGFGIKDVRNLLVEEKHATCDFDLIKVNETVACQYIDDDRLDGERMLCKAYFTQYEDGWKLDGVDCSERLFSINIWTGSSVRYYVNFNSYNK